MGCGASKNAGQQAAAPAGSNPNPPSSSNSIPAPAPPAPAPASNLPKEQQQLQQIRQDIERRDEKDSLLNTALVAGAGAAVGAAVATVVMHKDEIMDAVKSVGQLVSGLDFENIGEGAEMVMKLFDQGKDLIQTVFGCALPPPGGMVAVAVFEIAFYAVKAIFNAELCRQLALNCARILEILCQYRQDLEKEATLKRILEDFDAVVGQVHAIVEKYKEDNWFKRLKDWRQTKQQCEETQKKLKDVFNELQNTATLASFVNIQDLQKSMSTLEDAALKAAAKEEELCQWIDENGADEVVNNPKLRSEFAGKLKGKDQMVQKMLDASLTKLEEMDEASPANYIDNEFWKRLWKKICKREEIPDIMFWRGVERKAREVDERIGEALLAEFKDDSAKERFWTTIDLDNNRILHVMEVDRAFPPDADVVDIARKYTQGLVDRDVGLRRIPAPPAQFCGRDAEVEKAISLFNRVRVLLIHGGAGAGKACVAYQAAKELFRTGKVSHDAFYLSNLEGVTSQDSFADKLITEAFAEACGTQSGAGGMKELRSVLLKLSKHTRPILLLIEKYDTEVKDINNVLAEMLRHLPNLKIILTAQKNLDLSDLGTKFETDQLMVGPLSEEAAVKLLKGFKESISDQHAKQIAKKCDYNAHIMGIIGNALHMNRMDEEMVLELDDVVADKVSASVERAFQLVPPDIRAGAVLLSMFPTQFTEEGALRVMKGLIKGKYNLVQIIQSNIIEALGGSKDTYRMPGTYRKVAQSLLKDGSDETLARYCIKPGTLQAVQAAYAGYCLETLLKLTAESKKCPVTAGERISSFAPHVEAVLGMVANPDSPLLEQCRETLLGTPKRLGLLQLMLYNMVYSKEVVFKLMLILTLDCVGRSDGRGQVVCMSLAAATCPSEHGAWKSTAEELAQALSEVEGSEPLTKLVVAAGQRMRGVLLRDMFTIDDSIAALKAALAALEGCSGLTRDAKDLAVLEGIISKAELAGTLDYQGKESCWQEGRAVGQQAVDEATEFLGDNSHPILAMALTYYGFNLKGLNDVKASLDCHEKARELRELAGGKSHLDYAISLNQKAICLIDLLFSGDPEYANSRGDVESCLKESLKIRENVLGAQHPMVANTLYALGQFYRTLVEKDLSQGGELEQAELHIKKALEIRRERLGAKHPKVADCLFELHRIAVLDQGAEPQATDYLRQAAVAYEAKNPVKAASMRKSLSEHLLKRGLLEEAVPEAQKAAELFESKGEEAGAQEMKDKVAELQQKLQGAVEGARAEPVEE